MESTTVGFRQKEKKSAKVFLRVNDAHAEAFAEGEITEGAIGIEVSCEIIGERWEGLTKKLIVSDGVNGWPMMIRDGKAIIPHEALREGVVLMLGVDGWDAEGKLRIPTILAGACYVSKSVAGLHPMVPLPPSPDIVSQILAAAERALEIAADIERRADEHEFDGVSPTVRFTPIEDGYQITITDAAGEHTAQLHNGRDYQLTEEDKEEIAGMVPGYDDTEIWNEVGKKMVKHILEFDGTHIKEDGENLTFAALYEMLMEKPDFCVLVYNNYAYHPNGVSTSQIVFSSEYPVNGYDRAHRITMLANGTVTATETESEHTSSRVNAITEANEGSTVQYPSVKGVADYVRPIKQGLTQLAEAKPGTVTAELKQDLTEITDAVYIAGSNILPNVAESGYWNPAVGGDAEPKANASFTRCPYDIPITAGLSIYITTRNGLQGNKVGICEIGADGKTVAFENITAEGRRTVNANAIKMRVYINGTAIQISDVCISYENIPFEEYSVAKTLKISPSAMPVDETQIGKIMSIRKANNFAWKEYDKGVLSIRVDGGYATLDLIAKICADRNIPLILAPIVEWLDNPVTGIITESDRIGDTVRDVGKYIKDHKGEIVVYPRRPISTGDFDTQVLPWMIGYKGTLEKEFGQPVRGICVAQSATPEEAKNKIERYLYGYFDYSDGQGNDIQYNSQSTVATAFNFPTALSFQTWIDDICSRKLWKTFVCHQLDGTETGLGGLTESTFTQAMDYVASKVASGELLVMTWADVHDAYETSVLQKAIAALMS